MLPLELIIPTPDKLPQAAQTAVQQAGTRRKIILRGEMGAGKTTFVKTFCQYLGSSASATSPTFSLINQYPYQTPDGATRLIHHADLYRLRSLQEAIDIGIEEYLDDPNWFLIEWPELIQSILPDDILSIQIEILPDTSRKFTFS